VNNVDSALGALSTIVASQEGGDLAYFEGQSQRFRYTVQRLLEAFPPPRRVLDIGSHYLHQASLMSLLGYEVHGIDIPLFADAPFVADRARRLGICNHATSTLDRGTFLPRYENNFDLIVFTEILEHITFNPVALWRRIYELLKIDGCVYLTTPNAIRPTRLWKAAIRLATLRGVGLDVREILENVTYGHHWKEYSASELRRYFSELSPDFQVQVTLHSHLGGQSWRTLISRLLGTLPVFRTDIEAIVRLSGKSRFSAVDPHLPMEQTRVGKS
jgi:2-polyprenyl-6-hydroxyphenyl methylase/3-demethylubiquinone-9 3-methyltransferase